ncbi:MAG TPA: hypothetical protein VGC07_10460 [Granulicella sp.]
MPLDVPVTKIGRPSGAQGDWVMTLLSGIVMGGLTVKLLWPTSPDEWALLIPSVIAIAAVLASNFLRYTYGEIGPDGLHYRRPWGWRNASWDEIAGIEPDPKIEDAVLIRLRHGLPWTKNLRFQQPLTRDAAGRLDRASIIELYKQVSAK